MKILIANNPTALANAKPVATVEAEFGDTVVEGSVLTLAHHGSRSSNPAPCVAEVPKHVMPLSGGVIGVSHIDLDTLGGIGSIIGAIVMDGASDKSFWRLAAYVDVNGPHRLEEANASEEDVQKLYAFWAYNKDHRVSAPRDGSISDVTDEVIDALEALGDILGYGDDDDQAALIAAGQVMLMEELQLNRDSLLRIEKTPFGSVAVRSAVGFTNHLYDTDSCICESVLALNEEFKSITLSFSNDQGNACEIMQAVFGPDAGGHVGIAGTPRGKEYNEKDLEKVLAQMR